MARRFTCGFETPYYVNGSSQIHATRNEDNLSLTPGRCGGYAFTLDHAQSDINYRFEHDIRNINGGSAGSPIEPSYSRFYMRIRQFPNAGGSPVGTTIWSLVGDSDILIPAALGQPSVYGILLSDGTLRFYSKGDSSVAVATNLLGSTTVPLELDIWYRVNIYCKFNTVSDPGPPPDDSDAAFIVQIAEAGSVLPDPGTASGQSPASGERSFSWGGSTEPRAFEFGINVDANDAVWFVMGIANTSTGLNGGVIDFDDWVIDDAAAPGEGFVTLHRPIALGTHAEWTLNDQRRARSLPENITVDTASTGASTRLSFEIEPLASKGVTGTIKSVRIAGSVNAPRDGWDFGLRQNGVDNYNPATVTSATAAIGWFIDSGTLTVQPSDDLEIIIRDGSGAGANATMDFLCLVVDVEQEAFDPLSLVTDDIQVYEGTFVGTGGFQDIPVPFATPAEPDFVLVKPDNAGGTGGWWHRGLGNSGDGGVACLDSGAGPIAWVEENLFTVRANNGVNDLGETNRFIAFSDPSRRMSAITRFFTFNTAGQEDGRDVRFSDADFLAEAVFANTLNTGGTDRAFYRGPGHVGDLSSAIDANSTAAANIIQGIVSGSIDVGTVLQVPTLGFGVLALKTLDVFTDNVLCEIGSYSGNNAASRVIPLTLTGATGPGFIMVVPHNTTSRCCRFGSQVGTGSFRWNEATLNTIAGITGFDATSFTVTTGTPNLNASGVTYDYLVFGVGLDSVPVPPGNPLVIVVPQPDPDVELCEDCGCRMAYVPREDRLARIDRQIRAKVVPIDPRTEVILLDARSTTVFPENRELDIECA